MFSHKNRLLCKLVLILIILFSWEFKRLAVTSPKIARPDFTKPFFYQVLPICNNGVFSMYFFLCGVFRESNW